MTVVLVEVEAALRARGLAPRGAFHPVVGDGVPLLPDGRRAERSVLAGSVGASVWPNFARERRDEPDPLDRWSARVLDAVAARFGANVLLPSAGPPYLPFQRWAARAGPVHASPLGLLIHPDHGLWHAYRGALTFAERFALPPRDARPNPCDACRARPCLGACPVSAFTTVGYDDAAAPLSSRRGRAEPASQRAAWRARRAQ